MISNNKTTTILEKVTSLIKDQFKIKKVFTAQQIRNIYAEYDNRLLLLKEEFANSEYSLKLVLLDMMSDETKQLCEFNVELTGIERHFAVEIRDKATNSLKGFILTSNPPKWQSAIPVPYRVISKPGDIDVKQWLCKRPLINYEYFIGRKELPIKDQISFLSKIKPQLINVKDSLDSPIDYIKKLGIKIKEDGY